MTAMQPTTTTRAAPLISVVILNYNGARWLHRCLESLKAQTIFDEIEVIIADNASTDGSDNLAQELLKPWSNGKFLQNGSNLGFCEGNNRGAAIATGQYLFFLNNDTWLEPHCLENLLRETQAAGAQLSTPTILDYEDNALQSPGAAGYDIFGLMSQAMPRAETYEVMICGGCSLLIESKLFRNLGSFDPEIFLYADEYDLCWRAMIAGAKAVVVPSAEFHHRGAANVNPQGGTKVIEMRTSDSKRFYTNRNNLLVLLKNCQHILLLMVPLQLAMLAAEALVLMLFVRRWSFLRRAYIDAVADLWRLRGHISRERGRVAGFRKRNDFAMLGFLRWRLNRWEDFIRLLRLGPPRVSKG